MLKYWMQVWKRLLSWCPEISQKYFHWCSLALFQVIKKKKGVLWFNYYYYSFRVIAFDVPAREIHTQPFEDRFELLINSVKKTHPFIISFYSESNVFSFIGLFILMKRKQPCREWCVRRPSNWRPVYNL